MILLLVHNQGVIAVDRNYRHLAKNAQIVFYNYPILRCFLLMPIPPQPHLNAKMDFFRKELNHLFGVRA